MKRAWHAAAMRWKKSKQASALNPLAMESMSLENALTMSNWLSI